MNPEWWILLGLYHCFLNICMTDSQPQLHIRIIWNTLKILIIPREDRATGSLTHFWWELKWYIATLEDSVFIKLIILTICISFLWPLYQITTNLVAWYSRYVFSLSSQGWKFKTSFAGQKSMTPQASLFLDSSSFWWMPAFLCLQLTLVSTCLYITICECLSPSAFLL